MSSPAFKVKIPVTFDSIFNKLQSLVNSPSEILKPHSLLQTAFKYVRQNPLVHGTWIMPFAQETMVTYQVISCVYSHRKMMDNITCITRLYLPPVSWNLEVLLKIFLGSKIEKNSIINSHASNSYLHLIHFILFRPLHPFPPNHTLWTT